MKKERKRHSCEISGKWKKREKKNKNSTFSKVPWDTQKEVHAINKKKNVLSIIFKT